MGKNRRFDDEAINFERVHLNLLDDFIVVSLFVLIDASAKNRIMNERFR